MIYLDNAATTWPKPPAVITEMQKWLIQNGGNPGRGGHAASMQAARGVYEVREKIAGLFCAAKAKQVVFASNATHALNQALFGMLEPGDHVLTSSLEHNAVARPLWSLQQQGVQVTEVPGKPGQEFDLKAYASSFQPNTKKAPIVSFNIGEMDSMHVSYHLDEFFGGTARAGLHCAPHAQRLLGTLDQGVVRFSPSHFSTEDEIEEALAAVRETALNV